MMYNANLPNEIRMRVFNMVFELTTMLDSLTIVNIDRKRATRYEHFYGGAYNLQQN